ncbi:MaoC family dehydratase [Candidatus Methanomassiliicoccus intestinalis]|uniref:MaoC family dehydratase n=1 Tax=Candidatus Methanomassiliicoccus intestinalis TaxID=1406512 RepID=UPI0037DD7E45
MFLEDCKIGQKYEVPSILITKEDIIDFAKRYDNIPLHTDEEYAQTTRFKKIIASGMMSLLVIWGKFQEQDILGDCLIAGKCFSTEWFVPVFAGDILRGEVEIIETYPRNRYNGILKTKMTVYNHKNEIVLINFTEAVVKRKNTGDACPDSTK